MPKFVNNIDLNKNELRNAVVQVLSSAPSSPAVGQIYYDSVNGTLKICTNATGPVFLDLGKQGTVTNVTGSSPIQVANGSTTPSISIDAASGSAAGSMSAAHYTLVNNATNSNTASTIVKRDASGDFSAGTITANLTGNVTGNVSGSAGTVLALTGLDTDDLSEGTSNLYFTDTRVRANRLDQMAAPTTSVSFNSQKITSLADPTDPQDAATKAYVDAARSGLDVKQSVRAATTANIATLSGTMTVDDVSLIAGDRILVKNQSTASQNGIWVVAAGSWSRATDADSDAEVTSGLFTFVEEGTANGNAGFVLTTDNPITVGTTGLTFAQFSGAGQVVAGAGLTKTGNTIDAVGTSDRITVNADSIDIASTYVGQSSITTLGTVTTGTWNASTIGVGYGGTGVTTFTSKGIVYGNGGSALQVTSAGTQYQVLQAGSGGTPEFGALALGQAAAVSGQLAIANGGTGASTAAAARTALAVPTKFAGAVPSGSTTATITHSLNTTDIVLEVYEVSTGTTVYCDVTRTNANAVSLEFSVAPTSNQYRVVIIAVE